MRWTRLLLVGLLVVTAGCSGGSITDGEASIADRVDRDCDGALSALTIDATLSYSGSADVFSETDAYALVEYRPQQGTWRQARKLSEIGSSGFDRTISLSAVDLGTEGEVGLRIVVADADITNDQRLGTVGVGTVTVEPEAADAGTLDPSFDWASPVDRGETVAFEAADRSDSECEIVAFNWDFDGDGAYETQGRQASYTFRADGYHTVALTVVDSRGRNATVVEEVLVVFDPDGDGVTSAVERKQGTDPRDPDTDGDLFSDGTDPLPTSFLFPTGAIHAVLFALAYGLVLALRP